MAGPPMRFAWAPARRSKTSLMHQVEQTRNPWMRLRRWFAARPALCAVIGLLACPVVPMVYQVLIEFTRIRSVTTTLQYLEAHGQLSAQFDARPSDLPFDDGCFHFTPFRLSHDSADCFGYRIELQNGTSVAVCTDTGYVPDEARAAITGSDLVFLESNHEVDMLKSGPYPYYLKQRILSDRGHLSNGDSAAFAAELVGSGTTRVVLAHLSRENNMPELARSAAFASFEKIGAHSGSDYRLYVSAPENTERPIVL